MTRPSCSEQFHIDGNTFHRWRASFPEHGAQLLAWAESIIDPADYMILSVTLGEGWAEFETVPADRDRREVRDRELVTERQRVPVDEPPPTWPTLREVVESHR